MCVWPSVDGPECHSNYVIHRSSDKEVGSRGGGSSSELGGGGGGGGEIRTRALRKLPSTQ